MNSINMNRESLLAIVKTNKEKHVAEFQEALVDYAAAMNKIALDNNKIARENAKLVAEGKFKEIKSWKQFIPSPTSYEKEYTRAIAMLSNSVDEVIEVEQDVFNQLVLDEWNWKHSFSVSNTLYKTLSQ